MCTSLQNSIICTNEHQKHFTNHVATITTQFRQRAVLLIHMTKHITPAVASRLYTGYVRPVVDYASSLWQFQLSSAQATSTTLERLQARVARVILRQYGVYPPQTEPKASLFAHFQWPSLAWRRHIQCLLELHHLINSQITTLEDLDCSVSNSARHPNIYSHLLEPPHTRVPPFSLSPLPHGTPSRLPFVLYPAQNVLPLLSAHTLLSSVMSPLASFQVV